jgi:hypothetical protein
LIYWASCQSQGPKVRKSLQTSLSLFDSVMGPELLPVE